MRHFQQVSADYSLRVNDFAVDVTTGASTITVTLPNAASVRKEYEFRISKADQSTGLISIVPAAGEYIAGRASITLTHIDQVATLVSNGSGWEVKSFGGLSLRLGAYGTPVLYEGVGLINAYVLDSTADAAASLVGFWLLRSTTVDEAICFEPMIESECVLTGPKALKVVDALCGLTSTSSKLAAAVDHTDGMFAGHFKVYCVDGATVTAGARAAALWLDGQMNGANAAPIAANYYDIYATSGGNKFKAFAKLHLISGEGAGWEFLLQTNFGVGTDPIVAGAAAKAVDTVTQSENIKVDVNGTTRYIPLMAVA
jgi:hypothetical protein